MSTIEGGEDSALRMLAIVIANSAAAATNPGGEPDGKRKSKKSKRKSKRKFKRKNNLKKRIYLYKQNLQAIIK